MRDRKNTLGFFNAPTSRRQLLLRAGALGLSATALPALLEACGAASSTTNVNLSGPIDPAMLLSKTKAEGGLQAVGIPPEWADYAEILAGYSKKYGVPIDYKADAEYSSAQEVQVFQQSKIHPYGDVADVGFKWGPVVIQDGLVSPYKHANWADIPAELKDPAGNWCTEYWGSQAFVVNTKLVKNVPSSFAELLSGSYPNQVGIDGDPRQATDALYAVYSAALASSGSTSSIEPGIEYFANLKKKGNFTPARANEANIVQGEVPIAIIWDYLGLGYRDKYGSNPALQVIIPSDGALAGPYISIINKTAPHPFAARAWIEYLFSDEGQLFYLKGYAHPARYQALSAAGKIPADLAAKLPSSSEYATVKFVSDINALTQASTDLTNDWQSKVLGQ